MSNPIQRIFQHLWGGTLKLVGLAGLILLCWGTVAPVGTLVWWLKQDSESLNSSQNPLGQPPLDRDSGNHSGKNSGERLSETQASASAPVINCYVVFLTGVGDFSANQLSPEEGRFVDRLNQQHPNCVAVRDVFPYSAANESLGGRRFLAPLWEAAYEATGWLENADVLIKIRNLWRFAISIDDRYGPVYNEGIAVAIADRMQAAHPLSDVDSPLKLILIGTSGGAQVALGAAPYLDPWLNQWEESELIVISIGGDFSGSEGFDAADEVYHLQGGQDWIEDVTRIMFPSRWPWVAGSPINRARRQGRYHVLNTGPQGHTGVEGYFGPTPVENSSETTYLDLTLQTVNELPIWQSEGK